MGLYEEEKVKMDFNQKLWAMADKLRAEVDFTSCKEDFLTLIFLKHISDLHDFTFPEPKNLTSSLEHRLTHYQYINGGITNDNKRNTASATS